MHSAISIAAVFVVAIVSGAGAQYSPHSHSLRSELMVLHDHWVAAFDNADQAMLAKMESETFVLVFDGRIHKTSDRRPEDAKPRTYSRPVYGRRKLSDVEVLSFGDSATLTGKLASTTAAGTQFATATVVFVREEGRWRLARVHWETIVEDK